MTTTDPQATLTEAFHAVFDVKDTLPEGSDARYIAYEAVQKIDHLMDALGLDAPWRNDGEGRPTTDEEKAAREKLMLARKSKRLAARAGAEGVTS